MKPIRTLVLLLSLTACQRSESLDQREPVVPPQPSVIPTSPATDSGALVLVREYVLRDGRGERLGTNPWFIDAVDWPDEPGYDEITVIASYEVGPGEVTGDSARIPVVYRRVGRIETGENSARFVADTGQEIQRFLVERHENRWRISEPQINQHVLAERVLELIPLSDADRALLEQMRRSP